VYQLSIGALFYRHGWGCMLNRVNNRAAILLVPTLQGFAPDLANVYQVKLLVFLLRQARRPPLKKPPVRYQKAGYADVSPNSNYKH